MYVDVVGYGGIITRQHHHLLLLIEKEVKKSQKCSILCTNTLLKCLFVHQIDAVLRIPKMVVLVCALVATKRSKRSEKEPRNIEEYMLNCTVVSCY